MRYVSGLSQPAFLSTLLSPLSFVFLVSFVVQPAFAVFGVRAFCRTKLVLGRLGKMGQFSRGGAHDEILFQDKATKPSGLS